ncbi:MAG: hypothetical protein WDZ53_11525 [Balneolales bacterium]
MVTLFVIGFIVCMIVLAGVMADKSGSNATEPIRKGDQTDQSDDARIKQ